MRTLHENHIFAEKKKDKQKKRNDEAHTETYKMQIVSVHKKCTGKQKVIKYTYELLHTTEQE